MFENQSPESPVAAIAAWFIAIGFSAFVLYFLPAGTLVGAATQPLGILLFLVGVVIGGAQDAATLMNQQIRDVATNRWVVVAFLLVSALVGLVASVIFAENTIVYLEVACFGFVYSAAVVRTVLVWQHSRA